ncbi:MAG TPA: hypothetical protein VN081_03830 [Dongiaceae bacterium]|nr:hypothetical protein [Dongiaceae bacterium]
MSEKLIKQGAKATGISEKDNWRTPQYILDLVDRFYCRHPWFDPCPVDPQFNVFDVDCNNPTHLMYVNPPFSLYLDFVNHLLPWGGEQIWMMHHDHSVKRQKLLMEKASAMCFIKHRVRFINPVTGEPSKSSAIGKSQTLIYIGARSAEFIDVFSALGPCLEVRR